MGLVDRVNAQLRQPEAVRSDPITMEEFGYLLGRDNGNAVSTRSGVTMSAKRALGISAWYSGVRYISESVAGLPVHTFRDANGTRTRRADAPWLRRPDDEDTWHGWAEFTMMSLLHKGNAYSFKIRNPLGQVVGLRKLHPDRVRPGRSPSTGRKVFEIDGRTDVAFTSREILHIPGLSYDGVVGLNPIQTLSEPLGNVAAADSYAGAAFGNGDHVRAYLSVPKILTEPEAERMQALWQKMHRGLVTAHELAVLGGGAEYKTIGLDPQQTQLLETRKFGVDEVARILRLPPHKLYDLERATFSNIEHQSIEAVTDGIRPWVQRIEAWVNIDPDLLPARNFIELELEGMLRGDTKSRFEAYSVGIAGGFLMPAEPRRKENLPYIEGSEFLQRPLNMTTYGPDAVDTTTGHDDARQLSSAEVLQKVYLAAREGLISIPEARQLAGIDRP